MWCPSGFYNGKDLLQKSYMWNVYKEVAILAQASSISSGSFTLFPVMPSIATQTTLTAYPFSNLDPDCQWTKVDATETGTNVRMAGTDNFTVIGSSLQVPDFSDEAEWDPLPSNHLELLSKAYGRWRKTKTQKYEVKKFPVEKRFGDMATFADEWVRPRFNAWLQDRYLLQHLEPVQQNGCMEMQLGEKKLDFIKYMYKPSVGKPSFPWKSTVFHGTYPSCAARVLHTGKFQCSDWRIKGSDCRWKEPCVFTAETMDHGFSYAWPAPFLKDKLYYGIMYELEADRGRLINHREFFNGKNRKHPGEMLFPPEALIIRNVYLFLNLDLEKGSSKCQVLDPDLERLPFTVGESLTPYPLRRSTWSTWDNCND